MSQLVGLPSRNPSGGSISWRRCLAVLAAFVLAACLAGPVRAQTHAAGGGGVQAPMILDTTSTGMFRQQAIEGHSKHDFSPKQPPRRGKFVYGHWTPYEPPDPATYPPGSQTHTVVRGDTLWDLSGKYYKDNYLWPYIWDANPWVTYPHWIYPGDVLLIPSLMVMPAGKLEETVSLPSILEGYYPATSAEALKCGGFIADVERQFNAEIIGTESDPQPGMLNEQDVVYINVGAKDGVLPGDEFAIAYPRMKFGLNAAETDNWRGPHLRHPVTGDVLGDVIKLSGRLKVILLGESVSTARIIYSCDGIEVGNEILPFTDIPVVIVARKEHEEHVNSVANRGRGFIVYVQEMGVNVAPGVACSIDLGSNQGVLPGDVFQVYREFPTDQFSYIDVENLGTTWDYHNALKHERQRRPAQERTVYGKQEELYDTPPRLLGRIVVLYTEHDTATCLALNSKTEFLNGDKVVYEGIDEGSPAVRKVHGNLTEGIPLTRQPEVVPVSSSSPLR